MAMLLEAARYIGLKIASPSAPGVRSSRFLPRRPSDMKDRSRGQLGSREWKARRMTGRPSVTVKAFLPADPWAAGNAIDSQSIESTLFAASLFPYLGFLYHLTKAKSTPPLTLFGFYFLLAFVGATIPAGIYAKVHYGTSLSNVDWLHGSAESLLTVTNLLIVFGLRGALRKAEAQNIEIEEAEQEENLPLSK